MFFYDDTIKTSFYCSLADFDANVMFMKHLSNYMYLKFIIEHSDSFNDKCQANKEIEICYRKLDFWKKHPSYSVDIIKPLIDDLKNKWNNTVNIDDSIMLKHSNNILRGKLTRKIRKT